MKGSSFISLKRISFVLQKTKLKRDIAPYIITLIGSDRIGIVYKISKLLADEKINITDVRTEIIGEERSPVYTMILEIEIPKVLNIKRFKSTLKKTGKELKVDITIKPIEILEL